MITGYKGYRLVETGRSGSYHLISPTGVRVAGFAYTMAGFRGVFPIADGLDCGGPHKNEEQAIKYIARQYELLTMTRMQRFRRSVSQAFSHGVWTTIAATIAAATGLLNLFVNQPAPLPIPDSSSISPVEVQETIDTDLDGPVEGESASSPEKDDDDKEGTSEKRTEKKSK